MARREREKEEITKGVDIKDIAKNFLNKGDDTKIKKGDPNRWKRPVVEGNKVDGKEPYVRKKKKEPIGFNVEDLEESGEKKPPVTKNKESGDGKELGENESPLKLERRPRSLRVLIRVLGLIASLLCLRRKVILRRKRRHAVS